ncbi:MAG: sulfotransferase [Chloroflexota bacterium]|nr:MAG: sulfotransferase [Chloroflexota bacterium]
MKQNSTLLGSLERSWVSFVDSQRFRRFARQGVGARLLRGRAYQGALRAKRYATSYYQARTNSAIFADVTSFCFFIGHTKSGGTMIGALLDAHPNVILADEIDTLDLVNSGYRREQIFHILLKGSRREAMKGRVTARRLKAYSFEVHGQSQGRYDQLQVIGASKAGPTTRRLGADPALLGRTDRVMVGLNLKVIQVIRNPFDPMSAMRVRGKRTIDNAVDHYFDYCATLADLRQRLGDEQLLPVRYESFVAEPRRELAGICRFLGVEPGDDYLDACAAVIWPEPERSRDVVEWPAEWIDRVEEQIAQYDFLRGYRFDD